MKLVLRYRQLAFALPFLVLPAGAATLCANAAGAPGCSLKINDALREARAGDVVKVAPGIYKEDVQITKPISLVGDRATIDATGKDRGIFVNGMYSGKLSLVHVSGFTIENATLEGILVLNASEVTISGNTVMNNNKGLSGGKCPALPSFEPGEQQDCGEGIHLQAADHSIVTANTVMHNSGGILISDDTGPAHDNLISLNTVSDNAYACGITMASHVTAAETGTSAPFGVYHNTVYGNKSSRNGLLNGGGSGFGIFASIPGAKAYGNVVVDNYASENGMPGIAMHAHAPGQLLSDNMIVGNTLVNNAGDTADAATPGPTGINLYSLMPVTGNIFSGNTFQGESYDVAVKVPALVQVEFNMLLGTGVGVANLGTAMGSVDATENYWSCPSGPTIPGSCSSVSGPNVDTLPSLTVPITTQANF